MGQRSESNQLLVCRDVREEPGVRRKSYFATVGGVIQYTRILRNVRSAIRRSNGQYNCLQEEDEQQMFGIVWSVRFTGQGALNWVKSHATMSTTTNK